MSQVWLVTEAAHGAGRALAEAALLAGGRVVAGTREPGRLAAFVARYGARVRAVEFDATDEATVYAALDTALTAFGRIDVVVGEAGQADPAPIEGTNDTDLRVRFEANFFAAASVVHAMLPVLLEQGAGRIVQIIECDDGRAGASPARRAARSALRTYFETLAADAARGGIEIELVTQEQALDRALQGATAQFLRKIGLETDAAATRAKPTARIAKFPVRPEAA